MFVETVAANSEAKQTQKKSLVTGFYLIQPIVYCKLVEAYDADTNWF